MKTKMKTMKTKKNETDRLMKKINQTVHTLIASLAALREKAKLAAPSNPTIVAETETIIAKNLKPIIEIFIEIFINKMTEK
jgi:hypothetical protein